MYRRRGRRNLDMERSCGISISALEKNEALAYAFYIFELAKNADNSSICDNEFFYPAILQLAQNLGLKKRLDDVLQKYVEVLIKEGFLEYINEDSKSDNKDLSDAIERHIQYRCKLYVFEEDESLRSYCAFESATETERNFFRVLLTAPTPIFSQLVYDVFFSTAAINHKIRNIQEAPARILQKAKDISKINFLKKELDLSPQEAGYLLLRYRKATIEYLNEIFICLSKNSNELYTKLLGIDKKEFSKIVRQDQKIRQYGFINEDRELNVSIIECIENQDFSLYFADCIKTADLSNSYDLDTFSVPNENSQIYKKLLKSDNSLSILLYGKPGSGKTEYAKSLIKAAGKQAIIFKNEAEVVDKNDTLGRLNCLLSLNRKDSVLIVDEADSLLETTRISLFGPLKSSESKGIINKMLENSKNKVIWIVNHKSQMDESTLRRFTVSYRFEQMTPLMLEKIASKKLDLLNISSESKVKILNLLSNYKVTGASVDNIVKTIESMDTNDEITLLKNVEIVLKDNSTLLYGKAAMREKVSSAYDMSVLNTNISSEKILKMLVNAKRYADKNPGNGAVRMLFYGLSGTGKTEFARYISQTLGKQILLKRASDIFDKYVGGTEENIANAFKEAAANDMILLFDEADSFFADRNNAVRNYERTQVNEFLTQLEEFPGIVICTTNLRNIMDTAMLRRFHITVEFKALDNEGIETLLSKYFGNYEFSTNQIKDLAKYETVTAGDFGRLAGTIRFMDEEEISSEMIIEELCKIQREKDESDFSSSSHKIGFAE